MSKSKLEYIWLDGYKPTQNMRSKTKVEEDFSGKLEDCPIWSFDGSSTRQASGGSSDCLLKPVAIYPDPARKNGYLVMTEVLNADIETIPVFVPQGSIIPLGKVKKHVNASPDDTLTLKIYPGEKASFTLYEDDGISKDYKNDAYTITKISCTGNDSETEIIIGEMEGGYDEMVKERTYISEVYMEKRPQSMKLNEKEVEGSDYQYNEQAKTLIFAFTTSTNEENKIRIYQ